METVSLIALVIIVILLISVIATAIESAVICQRDRDWQRELRDFDP